ncbi:hypothetical protein VTN00DRAFT_5358 [Thermoascus crustaceus]|uniref:uncharacterized protein n=1 Tax=Thermoascus crustaceus TaxID=5088 RepID=UPI0037446E10
MPLKDILHKKDKIGDTAGHNQPGGAPPVSPQDLIPELRFTRTDTHTEEVLRPPVHDGHNGGISGRHSPEHLSPSSSPNRLSIFRRSRSPSESSSHSPTRAKGGRRLSSLLGFDRDHSSRNASSTSLNVPSDLPQIGDKNVDNEEREAQWEKRATMLVQGNPHLGPTSRPSSSYSTFDDGLLSPRGPRTRSWSNSRVNDPEGDVSIQEAIRLHEAGELEASTQMFGQLADPNGANNALSQVLYGLALRHGWGCTPDPAKAITYLSAAASNSASIEEEALRAGMKKGGVAKGELVLAIFELGNCFRNGWGVEKDPVAARQYYETAANLGDADAMNEIAWCYLEGFGGKKDKYMAAKYYRLAEENGNKILGNSWYVTAQSLVCVA